MKNSNSYSRGVIRHAVAGLGVALFVSSSSFAFAGRDITETRDVDTFHSIRILGGVQLNVKVGRDQKLEITTDDDFMEHVEIEVRNGVLIIDTAHGEEEKSWYEDEDTVEIDISMREFKELDVRGAVDADIRGIDTDELIIDIRGAGKIELEGTCGELELDIKGAAAVDAEDLKCKDVEVTLRGTGFATVYASEKVDADLRGIGVINISGDPDVVKESVRGIGVINN